jgi:hypothetical protein
MDVGRVEHHVVNKSIEPIFKVGSWGAKVRWMPCYDAEERGHALFASVPNLGWYFVDRRAPDDG